MHDTHPNPLTPATADLRDFPFMPLDVMRLRDSDLVAEATGEEFKAAVLLWCAAWHQIPAGSIPNTERWLARHSGAGSHWKKVSEVALRGWVECSDGRLYHPVICEKVLRAWKRRQALLRRENRRLHLQSADWAAIRSQVFERDDFTCTYCHERGVELECDHVVPVASGGETTLSNLTTACKRCNRSKGSKALSAWREGTAA
jgi:5-methylcytosine-specific restriction endonuclease McrA